jgi:zinc D-Ala-D-Ala carboxypeptidase
VVERSGITRSGPKRRLQLVLWLFGSFLACACGCATTSRPELRAAASRNGQSLYALPLNLFGRPERGWAVYAPRVEESVGSGQARADETAFAAALSRWQARNALAPTGVVDAASLAVLKAGWQAQRPFVALRVRGACPAAPAPGRLTVLRPDESLGGRPLQLRPGALNAYRRMVAAARRAEPLLAARPELLSVFSAYRSPARDAGRCAAEGNCQGVVRAACSAHRTGLALDLTLEAAPGHAVDGSDDVNRLAMTRGIAYRWLLANAPRFGFVNYGFEPWHWEWTGEAP